MKSKTFIAGNWKMNKGVNESLYFMDCLQKGFEKDPDLGSWPASVEIIIFPSIASLHTLKEKIKIIPQLSLGVQNVYTELSGPYTGENSVLISREAGAQYALVGHSERRHIFHENDEITSKKYEICKNNGLKPVLCVGETEDQRNSGVAASVITKQIEKVFENMDVPDEKEFSIIVAYEPVWAIGTGNNATAKDAERSCAFIRGLIKDLLGETTAKNSILLYGGSVNSSNAIDYLDQENINGLLVGGASLDPGEFLNIIRSGLSVQGK